MFTSMLDCALPIKWKMKKFTPDEFQNLPRRNIAETRLTNPVSSYNTLYLRGSINVRYNAEEGTFKVSGTYGVWPNLMILYSPTSTHSASVLRAYQCH